MATREDVYRKFGEASEVAQLLETELGTLLLMRKCIGEDLLTSPDRDRATEIYRHVNRQTLGRLIRTPGTTTTWVGDLEQVFTRAAIVTQSTRAFLLLETQYADQFGRRAEDNVARFGSWDRLGPSSRNQSVNTASI